MISMNPKAISAGVLIILGIVVLAYSGVSFTAPGQAIDFYGLRVESCNTRFVPPAIGTFGIICGTALLLLKPRSIW